MAQDYALPEPSDSLAVAVATKVSGSLEALATLFAGSTSPSSPFAGQPWHDTANGILFLRDGANTAWIPVLRLGAAYAEQLSVDGWDVASLSATRTAKLGVCRRAGTVKRLVLLCETASTSSSGNEWQVQVKRYPNSAPGSPVNLFSAAVGTFTALAGVGGGAEFVAHQALVFTPNQNAAAADLDVLELVLTRVGSATTLANFRAFVELA